jgi:hypothetical protein
MKETLISMGLTATAVIIALQINKHIVDGAVDKMLGK